MKKIVLLSCKDNTFYNFRSELILELSKLYEVVLVCPYGKKMDFFIENGIRFIDLPMDRRGKNIFKDLKLIKRYKKLLIAEKPDVVLTFTTKPSYYGAYVCKKLKIPCIVNNAGYANSGFLMTILFNFLYKHCENKASCLMFQNSYERDKTESLLKWKVPYRDLPGSGVNLEHFSYVEYPKNNDDIIFNYVARIVKFKGIDEFLECAKIIHHKYSNMKFRIYGDYDDDSYKKIIKEFEDQGIVEYKGVLLDMKPAIAECNAVIHPSHYEGMTNVVLEHSAMGRPCIGSNVPGVKDGIDDGKTGYIFEVGNANSLIVQVEKFINLNNNQRKEMGVAARKKMEKEFDREIVTNTYLEVIDEIFKQKGL